MSIPFPFGTTPECYQTPSFFVRCNQTGAFVGNSSIQITNISLDGQLRVLQFIVSDCYNLSHSRVAHHIPYIYLPTYFTVNNTANKFTILGCDTYGFVYGHRLHRNYVTGCTAVCSAMDDLARGQCTGLGCCQTSIPKEIRTVNVTLGSFNNYSNVSDFNNCGYGFLVEENAFTFYPENFTNLRSGQRLPMVVDWAIGNGTCQEAMKNASSYACVSVNSTCYKPDNGYGYRCSCQKGYRGNPYIRDGCQDINECQDSSLNICDKICKNTEGGFECVCPKGYHGDGKKNGRGCIQDASESLVVKLVAGISLGAVIVVLSACVLYSELKRRRLIKERQNYFLQNGGELLRGKLRERNLSPDTMTKIYRASELEKATNNFHRNEIIGQGGFGMVYKGFLPNNTLVAIKKSKEVDPDQVEQFINEVIVLSQINHRNVVKLFGCCLEKQTPLLVYEFIDNGTLHEHIHNKAKARAFPWVMRLKIAAETAGVLSYLHSAASTPIVHRDIKSPNILLDHTYTAKVCDFGASRLVPSDQMQLSTIVQGTLGYLDPEYMQTNQLTEKSDVYSFGVVLLELLTGLKAFSYARAEEDKNLANYFLSIMRQERLCQIIDVNIVASKEQITKVGLLAKRCISLKGDDRPSMKEVAMELEGLQNLANKHTWADDTTKEQDDEKCLLGPEESSSSTNVLFDSLKDQVVIAVGRGR